MESFEDFLYTFGIAFYKIKKNILHEIGKK